MNNGLWLLGIVLFLAGCATEYRREVSASDLSFDSVESAVKGVGPIGVLTQEGRINIKVDRRKSPVITLDGVKSGFEIVAVEGKKGQDYHLNVTSICDCLGFRKLILYPVGHLLDAKGATLSTGRVYYIGGLGPIEMQLNGRFPADGTYYLMIAANNANPGETVRKNTLLVMPFLIPLPMLLKSYPEGELFISWGKPKRQVDSGLSSQ